MAHTDLTYGTTTKHLYLFLFFVFVYINNWLQTNASSPACDVDEAPELPPLIIMERDDLLLTISSILELLQSLLLKLM